MLALTKSGSIAGRRLYSYGMSGREKTAVHQSLFARAGIRAEFVTRLALQMMGAFLASVASEVLPGGIQVAVLRFHYLGHLQRRSCWR